MAEGFCYQLMAIFINCLANFGVGITASHSRSGHPFICPHFRFRSISLKAIGGLLSYCTHISHKVCRYMCLLGGYHMTYISRPK